MTSAPAFVGAPHLSVNLDLCRLPLTSHHISSTRACHHENHICATDAPCSARTGPRPSQAALCSAPRYRPRCLRAALLALSQRQQLPRVAQPRLRAALLPSADGKSLRAPRPSEQGAGSRVARLASTGDEPVKRASGRPPLCPHHWSHANGGVA